MPIPCSENTVLINTTHKILSQLQSVNAHLVATMPTPQMENILGYDTEFPSWKLFFLQYKRPYYRKGRYYYHLNRFQTVKLLTWPISSGRPCAFFPLVLVNSDQHLAKINPNLLDNVFFVDVTKISPISTMIRVDAGSPRKIQIDYKICYGPWVQLKSYHRWHEVKKYIHECEFGGIMKRRGERTESNRLFREVIRSLEENILPQWWRSRAIDMLQEHFDERLISLFFKSIDQLLTHDREMRRPTRIGSRSFRAFVYPIENA